MASESVQVGKLYHNVALGLVVACPLIALLPPRRLNLTTGILVASWTLSANYLVQGRRNPPTPQWATPPRQLEAATSTGTTPHWSKGAGVESQVPVDRAAGNEKSLELSMSKTVKANKSRAAEYQDKLDEGASYGDIIKEQIWDVWNQEKGHKD